MESDKQEKLSVCDIMKEDTSEIIKKMESTMPSLFQNYSNLYTKYLHLFNDMFGTCYIAEKEFFDKLNIDQGVLRQIKANSESMKNNYVENIDMTAKLFDEYIKMRIEAIQSFDNYVHVMMESYTKILSQFNKSMKYSK
jgi:hypothetical protein